MFVWSGGGQVIEGISNEVLYFFLTLAIIFISSLSFVWKHRHRALQTIHPASTRLVEEMRNRLGIGGEEGAESVSFAGGGDPDPSGRAVPSAPPQEPTRVYNRDRVCPICFANSRFAIQTNCGHVFCGQCIISYWTFGNWLGPVNCPVCRSAVTILLSCFEEVDLDEVGRQEIVDQINSYNRRFSGEPRPWLDYVRDIPVLIPHLIQQFFSTNGLLYMFRLRIIMLFVAAAAYVLSPFDIIPEAVFGILGLLDDAFIFFMIMVYLCIAYRGVVRGED